MVVVGAPEAWSQAARVRRAFDDSVLAFLDDLSRALLADDACRRWTDVVAFALWCRRSALAKLRASYEDGSAYLGRGLVFHVSPKNVPIMFAYTLAVGLLAGDANIVRLPSRAFPQVDLLCRHLDRLVRIERHRDLLHHVLCIRYDRQDFAVTRLLSERCDVRVIWGGDHTIREIRRAPLDPAAFDVVFPSRYSIAVIDGDAWLACEDKERQLLGFYNDTYLTDQGSCSAPRLVVWLGSQVERARESFWALLAELVAARRPLPAEMVSKLEYAYWVLARHPGSKLCAEDPRVTRLWCEHPDAGLLEDHPGGGVFVESRAASLEALLPVLERRCQTLSYYGVAAERLASLVCDAGPRGGHRVVPLGRTLDFSPTWDGYDTIRALSRRLTVVGAGAREVGA